MSEERKFSEDALHAFRSAAILVTPAEARAMLADPSSELSADSLEALTKLAAMSDADFAALAPLAEDGRREFVSGPLDGQRLVVESRHYNDCTHYALVQGQIVSHTYRLAGDGRMHCVGSYSSPYSGDEKPDALLPPED